MAKDMASRTTFHLPWLSKAVNDHFAGQGIEIRDIQSLPSEELGWSQDYSAHIHLLEGYPRLDLSEWREFVLGHEKLVFLPCDVAHCEDAQPGHRYVVPCTFKPGRITAWRPRIVWEPTLVSGHIRGRHCRAEHCKLCDWLYRKQADDDVRDRLPVPSQEESRRRLVEETRCRLLKRVRFVRLDVEESELIDRLSDVVEELFKIDPSLHARGHRYVRELLHGLKTDEVLQRFDVLYQAERDDQRLRW